MAPHCQVGIQTLGSQGPREIGSTSGSSGDGQLLVQNSFRKAGALDSAPLLPAQLRGNTLLCHTPSSSSGGSLIPSWLRSLAHQLGLVDAHPENRLPAGLGSGHLAAQAHPSEG